MIRITLDELLEVAACADLRASLVAETGNGRSVDSGPKVASLRLAADVIREAAERIRARLHQTSRQPHAAPPRGEEAGRFLRTARAIESGGGTSI